MTVAYIHRLPNGSSAYNFLVLLTMWRGSVFKGIWGSLLVYCFLYTVISVIYRCQLVRNMVL